MSKTILVVDDNEMNRKLLRVLLSSRGYSVEEAETGQTGLAQAKSCQPNLILLDYRLPDMNGVEIARELKSDDRYASIPIIIVTAIALSEESARITRESGCLEYITKPIDVHALLDAVEKHIA
ncbi:MAG: response regulator [Elusimicrobiaceae bacterium]|nr:response regulator [Elusimicrobiaceae bacterium]